MVDALGQGHARAFGRQRGDQLLETGQRIARPCGQAGALGSQLGGLPQREAQLARQPPHLVQGALANAAGRGVDCTLEGGVIVAVGHQAQVGQRVLDFGALEKAHAAIHAVGHLLGQQGFFDRPRLHVGAVQHRHIGVAAAIAYPLPRPLHRVTGLVHLVVGRIQVDRVALPGLGPQLLADAVRVVFDHRIGRGQDVAGGAVVLLQADGLRAREVLQEALYVLDLGPAPAIDGLVIVTDHEHLASLPGQHADEGVLDGVGVLELVHQQVAETGTVMGQQRRVVAQQLVRAQQQLGKVDQPGAVTALLVGRIGLAHGFRPRIMRSGLDVLGTPALVLLLVDPPGNLLGRVLGIIDFQRLDHALDQPQLVIAVEHLEAFRQPRLGKMQPQQAVGQAMEGADPHPAAAGRQLRIDAVAHFAGGLVGEGHREDAMGWHAHDFMQPGDAVGQHPGLAGTGAGKDQVVSGRRGNGLALGCVEPVEQVGNIHWRILRESRPGHGNPA